MSALQEAVEPYVALRQALGFKLKHARRYLLEFVAYLESQGVSYIQTRWALAWACRSSQASPKVWWEQLSLVRGLARYMAARDPRTEIPPHGLLPPIPKRPHPRIYTDSEVMRLMEAARHWRFRWKGCVLETLLGLLASTGMRVGEALALDQQDVAWGRGLLVVRSGKLGKSREVLLHPTTLEALQAYGRRRDRTFPRPRTPAFFVSTRGTRLIYAVVQAVFRKLVRRAGLSCGRLHDLRHTFAVHTLQRWYREGADVDALVPRLSTYLGHVEPSSTYWYFSATPELMALARHRLERLLGDTP